MLSVTIVGVALNGIKVGTIPFTHMGHISRPSFVLGQRSNGWLIIIRGILSLVSLFECKVSLSGAIGLL